MDGRDEDNKLLTAAESEMSTRGPTSDTEAGDAASGLAVADCARADILVLRYFFSLRFFKVFLVFADDRPANDQSGRHSEKR